jgi:TM2 domain-containing membrane protein YozV
MSAGQGSSGNVIAAIASFFIPGLGQLVQGRILAALMFLLLAAILWTIAVLSLGLLAFLGAVPPIWACVDAALWRGPGR